MTKNKIKNEYFKFILTQVVHSTNGLLMGVKHVIHHTGIPANLIPTEHAVVKRVYANITYALDHNQVRTKLDELLRESRDQNNWNKLFELIDAQLKKK